MSREGTTLATGAIRGAILGVAVAAACLCAAASQAAEDDEEPFVFVLEDVPRALKTPASEIEVGALHVSEDSFKFGDFTGLEDEGVSALGNVDIQWRSPYDSPTAHYLWLKGLNLGLDSRTVDAEYGQQGLFGLSFVFDEIPKFQTDSVRTPFRGTDGTNLGLPGGWVEADSPAGMTQLDASLRPLEVDHLRRRIGGGASLVLPMNVEFQTHYLRENKRGSKLMGAVIGNSGGNPRAAMIPEELDYVTDQVDATFRYAREQLQLHVQYYGSGFENGNNRVRWENPYSTVSGWDARVPSGQKGQPPDNWFHQVSATGGYNLPLDTRVTLNAAFGWMLQDDDFLPFTVNYALACDGGGLAPCPLPRSSLDGRIETRLVDFRVASRPLPRTRVNFGYRYDERDNETPRDIYHYIGGDSSDQEPIESERARLNRPYSLKQHKASFDAGYRIFTRTDLTLGYEWERTERDFQEVAELDEHTLEVKLHGRPCPFFDARANYARSWRDGSGYENSRSFILGSTPEHIAEERVNTCGPLGLTDEECLWANHPLLRKYYLADRDRDDLRFLANVMPLDTLDIGLNLGFVRDDYGETEVGLTQHNRLSSGVDVSFVPIERVTTHAFYTFERIRAEQNGWYIRGSSYCVKLEGGETDPTCRWSSQDEDNAHTAGFGLEVDVLPERLGIGADYVFTKTRGSIGIQVGPTLLDRELDGMTPPVYPDITTRLHSLNLHADYQLTEELSLRLGYLLEDFKSSDWALDGVNPDTLSRVIATGEDSPDYRVHVAAWSLVYRFQ